MLRSSLILGLVLLFYFFTQAQNDTIIPKKHYQTLHLQGKPPVIDGQLDDLAWNQMDWGSDFVQISPYEGKAPTQETAFKILYDDRNLYVAFRCFDQEPDKIVRRMSRRDGFEGDWVEINIDSYHDKRTAFSFTTSVSGVKGDEFISNNGQNWDDSWNPIWQTKTNIDSLGWTAEVRIPLSQIRYAKAKESSWGLQFTRRDFRNESRSTWQFIPQNNGNWVSSFGVLDGLKNVKPQKQIEIQPYIVGSHKTFEQEEGNPFADGSTQKLNGGLDGKIGVTSDLTLDFTINPDFGQVEADPSALNLDGYRIFFSERRPFFIENRNLFDYQFAWAEAGGSFTDDNLFYSRRIGSAPHGSPDLNDGEYLEMPNVSTILGAAKFSGKTKNGLGIGILESVTAREVATIDLEGERREEVVEPLSNYFVGRLTQDFNEGQTFIGGIFTATLRDLEGTNLDYLHESAYSGGLDLKHWWKDRTYFITANAVFSNVQGSTEAITRTQKAFEHYFQRPDATHLSLDTNATSLTGFGGMLKVGRLNKNWKFETGVTWRSPELELNDLGFMVNADEINYFLWTGYRFTEPFSVFRWAQINYNHYFNWDFSGRNLLQAYNTNLHSMFTNFWRIGGGVTYEHRALSNNALFGGPTLRASKGIYPWMYISTDQRKAISLFGNLQAGFGFDQDEPNTTRRTSYYVGLQIQPSNALNINIGPRYTINKRKIQNVTSDEYDGETRYITGRVDQRTLSLTVRLNYSITPNLTLQYYGQPFISKGNYDEFKVISDPLARNFNDRFISFAPDQVRFDGMADAYLIDFNRDDTGDVSFDNPDFNFMQFRSNLVARWEYVPGSELFLVWSQGNTSSGDPEEALLPSLKNGLFAQQGENTFLIKWTYRFLL